MRTSVQILSDEEQAKVHERTLHILSKTGTRVDTEKGRAILENAGALVDRNTNIVRYPMDMVESAIRTAPEKFALGSRRPGRVFQMNQGECTLCMNGEGTSVIDRKTGEFRIAGSQDWLDITRLADGLDEIGIYWRSITPSDHGDGMAEFVDYTADVFRNFSKHVQDPFMSPDQAPWLLEILQAIFGDRETIRRRRPYSTLLCPQSPLVLEQEYTDAYLSLKGWDIPVAVMPMALMGATAPASMISTLIQCNCEVLGALCLIQANEPGAPFLYAPVPTLMDPRTGRYFCGGVENAVMNAAAVEMAKYYGFPSVGSGFGTDAFAPSIQGGYERALNAVLPSMANPDILIGPGLFGGDMILSFEQMIIDVEMFRMFERMGRGIASDDDKWLDNVIEEIGPSGNYLSHASTARNIRGGEWRIPGLGIHDSFETWEEGEKRSLKEEAREKVDHILKTHQPLPLDDDIEMELARIKKRAEGERA